MGVDLSKNILAASSLFLILAACGGGGGSGSGGNPAPTPNPPSNSPPAFSSGTEFSVAENEIFETEISVSDPDGDDLTVSITSSGDGGFFEYNAASNTIVSNGVFDFETPSDTNKDNVYLVELDISDGRSTTSVTISVSVTNVVEGLADLGAVAILGNQTNKDMGAQVAAISDLDGDGKDEVVFSASRVDGSSASYDGAVYIFGSRLLNTTTAKYLDLAEGLPDGVLRFDGSAEMDMVGLGVDTLGDLDGDGFDELAIGMGANEDERVYLLLGNELANAFSRGDAAIELRDTPSLGMAVEVLGDPAIHGGVGLLTRAVGDFDQDGVEEILICAPWSDSGDPDYRTSLGYVLFGDAFLQAMVTGDSISLSDVVSNDQAVLIRQKSGQNFGCESGAGVGDFNGDSIDDLLLPDPSWTFAPVGPSSATHLLFGQAIAAARESSTTIFYDDLAANEQGMTFVALSNRAATGGNVAGIGDVNADGYNDILISGGSTTYPDQIYNAGVHFIIFGGNNLEAIAASGYSPDLNDENSKGVYLFDQAVLYDLGVQMNGARPYDNVDVRRLPGGDMDDDGRNDVIISAGFADGNDLINSGEVYIVYGKSLQPSILSLADVGTTVEGLRLVGMDDFDIFGADTSFGDFDGDGQQDLLIGAFAADPNDVSRGGEVYILSGKGLADRADLDGQIRIENIFPELNTTE